MTSCDDGDFSLLAAAAADDHHQQQQQSVQQKQYHNRASATPPSDAAFVNRYESAELDRDPDSESNPNSKRKDRDEVSDTGTTSAGTAVVTSLANKKLKSAVVSPAVAAAVAMAMSSAEYRKDREEWSDAAIESLLDAYTEKYTQLSRGNLRGRDWEEVSAAVSERCENQSKSVEQCKNKVDNLKKRYKLERHRLSSTGATVSHWPWYTKMEPIVGNLPASKAVSDEDKAGGSTGGKRRYAIGTPGPLGQINNLKSKSVPTTKWQRVIFKISGAALAGNGLQNVDPKVVMLIAREVSMAHRLGVQVAIVIGGRNLFCGETWANATGTDRCLTYQIGVMATVMNSVLVQSALEKLGVQTRLQTAIPYPEVGEPYNRQRAIRHLEKGRVVIFGGVGGGSGNPLLSTDTTAALRASEIQAGAVLKGANVDGIHDPTSECNGVTFEHISYRDAASRGPTSVDLTALSLCEGHSIPVVVFNLHEPGNISKALCGEKIGTLIDQTGTVS